MPRAYPADLRERVLADCAAGVAKAAMTIERTTDTVVCLACLVAC